LLTDNQFIRQRAMRPRVEVAEGVPDRAGLLHTTLYRHPKRTNPLCSVCRRNRTTYLCRDCDATVCQWVAGRDCHLLHMLEKVDGQEWLEARARAGQTDEFHHTEVYQSQRTDPGVD
jgi:hypothetical protein